MLPTLIDGGRPITDRRTNMTEENAVPENTTEVKKKIVALKIPQYYKLCKELEQMKSEIETGGLTKGDVLAELKQRTGIEELNVNHVSYAGEAVGVKFKKLRKPTSRVHGGSLYQELKGKIDKMEQRLDELSKTVEELVAVVGETQIQINTCCKIVAAHLIDSQAHDGKKWIIKDGALTRVK